MRRTAPRLKAETVVPKFQTLLAVLALVLAWVVMAAIVGVLAGCGMAAGGTALDRSNPVGTFHRGLAAVDEQQFGEAVQAFRYVAEEGFCDPGWNNAGVAYCRLGDHAAALAAYDRAMVECPSEVVLYNRGSLHLRQRRFVEAARDLKAAVALEPAMAEAWNNLGLALLLQGRQGEALLAMQSAVKRRPSLARPWNNLGVIYARMGRTAQARMAYQRALSLDAGHAKARRNLKRLCQEYQQVSRR